MTFPSILGLRDARASLPWPDAQYDDEPEVDEDGEEILKADSSKFVDVKPNSVIWTRAAQMVWEAREVQSFVEIREDARVADCVTHECRQVYLSYRLGSHSRMSRELPRIKLVTNSQR